MCFTYRVGMQLPDSLGEGERLWLSAGTFFYGVEFAADRNTNDLADAIAVGSSTRVWRGEEDSFEVVRDLLVIGCKQVRQQCAV
jgi:hypothetical protein